MAVFYEGGGRDGLAHPPPTRDHTQDPAQGLPVCSPAHAARSSTITSSGSASGGTACSPKVQLSATQLAAAAAPW